jgi:hypothetical protein
MNSSDRFALVLSIGGAAACTWLGVAMYRGGIPVIAAVSAAGSLASFVGLTVVALQLAAVRKASLAAASAAGETRESLTKLLALADVSKTIKLVEQIQNDVGAKKYEIARIRMQDVRANMVQFQPRAVSLGAEDVAAFERCLINVGLDLANLYDAAFETGKPINASTLSRNLEEVVAVLLRVERHIKLQG